MTYGLKMSMNGLQLGTVRLLDLDQFADKGNNPLANPLQYSVQGATPVLRYRNPSYQLESVQGGYELALGAVIAAAAIIYSSHLLSTPTSLAIVMLVRDVSRADGADEGLRVIVVEPGRTGDSDVAHPVDEPKMAAVKKAVRESTELEVSVLPDDAPADIAQLVKFLVTKDMAIDVDVPLQTTSHEALVLNLPDSVTADADGRFYFRDALTGEADFLFEGQNAHPDLNLLVEADGGHLTLLGEDEKLVNLRHDAQESPTASLSSKDVGDIEHFLTRLVLNLDGGKEVDVHFSVYTGEVLLLQQSINVLHQDPYIVTDPQGDLGDGVNVPFEVDNNHLVEEHSLEDVLDNLPDIL